MDGASTAIDFFLLAEVDFLLFLAVEVVSSPPNTPPELSPLVFLGGFFFVFVFVVALLSLVADSSSPTDILIAASVSAASLANLALTAAILATPLLLVLLLLLFLLGPALPKNESNVVDGFLGSDFFLPPFFLAFSALLDGVATAAADVVFFLGVVDGLPFDFLVDDDAPTFLDFFFGVGLIVIEAFAVSSGGFGIASANSLSKSLFVTLSSWK